MRPIIVSLLSALLTISALAQAPTSKGTLEASEALFATMAALNACGYDQDLQNSHPLRAQIRADVGRAVNASPAAAQARTQVCAFIREKQLPDAAQDAARYVSLAMNLTAGPVFNTSMSEADLPPDASQVLGFLPRLQRFYDAARLGTVWQRYQPEYAQMIEQHHEAVSNMMQQTDLYLRMPISGYVGRRFAIYLEPQIAPGQTNARNYADDYLVAVSPGVDSVKLADVRHTYLHFVLEPLAAKRPMAIKRLEPLLLAVENAPIDSSYKQDMSLMVTESLIRAVEARLSTPGSGKAAEALREQSADAAVREGYVLVHHFHKELERFEKSSAGFRDAFGEMIRSIDLGQETRRAEKVVFAAKAAPDVLRASKPRQVHPLDLAEQRLATGDPAGAHQLAGEVLESKLGEPARALFIMARAATLRGDLQAARTYFERTLESTREPRLQAWSHIYLGRLFDLMAVYEDGTLDEDSRNRAVQHYQAALNAGDPAEDTRVAAEKGLQQPYSPALAKAE